MKKVVIMVALAALWPALMASALNDLRRCAQAYKEDVLPSNKDYFNPDFSSYLISQRPWFFESLLYWLALKEPPFSIEPFKDLLKKVIETQKSRGRQGDFVLKSVVREGDKCVVIGTIQGAFHSLVRDIEELVAQKVLDESLKIQDPRVKIIFNGNALSGSPYCLQTLWAILLLMNQNPDQVFYLKSDYEYSQLWKSGTFFQQLDVMYRKQLHPIQQLYSEFIQVLPEAFYCHYADQPEKLLKFAAITQFFGDHYEKRMDNFFFMPQADPVAVWNVQQKQPAEKIAFTTTLFDGTAPTVKIPVLEPLMFTAPIEAASVWRIFSGASILYDKLYNIKEDAFGIIEFGASLASSTLLFFTHARAAHNERFKNEYGYDLDTGVKRSPGQKHQPNQTIFIGSVLDLSRSNFNMGDRLRTGMSLALRDFNQREILKDKEVQLLIFDDENAPRLASENISKLIKDFKVHTLLLPLGDPTLLSSHHLVCSSTLLAVFSVTGAEILREPTCQAAVNFRPSFADEVTTLLDYILNVYNYKSIAFFYQDDPYGNECMNKAREILKQAGIEKWLELPYTRNTTNFERQKELLKDQQIEAFGCFSTSQSTQEFFRQLGAGFFASTKVFALSFAVDDAFEAFVNDELGIKCLFSRVVPSPVSSDLEVVKEYRKHMDAIKRPYDVYSLEGYIGTSILCDMIARTEGPFSHTALFAQFVSLKDYAYKGLTLTYNPQNNQISRRIWLDFQDGTPWKEMSIGSAEVKANSAEGILSGSSQ